MKKTSFLDHKDEWMMLSIPIIAVVATIGLWALGRFGIAGQISYTTEWIAAVVGIDSDKPGPLLTPDQRRLLDALMDQAALAIERVRLVEDLARARRTAETDRLLFPTGIYTHHLPEHTALNYRFKAADIRDGWNEVLVINGSRKRAAAEEQARHSSRARTAPAGDRGRTATARALPR